MARGVHPAILSQSGLAPALSSLAEDAPVAMTLAMDRSLRLPTLIEATAYLVVVEALSDAATAGSTEVAVSVVRIGHPSPSTSTSMGAPPEAWPVRIADRVGAAGGDLTLDHPSGDRTRHPGGDAMRVIVAEDLMLTREGIVRLLSDAGGRSRRPGR